MCVADYVGCYRETRPNRVFAMSPGGYDQSTLNSNICRQRCAYWNYQYAGLTAGSFCFCSNTLPAVSALDSSGCTIQCPGGLPADKCGSMFYVSVWTTPLPITGLSISAFFSKQQSGATNTFSAVYATGPVTNPFSTATSGVRFSFNFGDGGGWTTTGLTTSYSHTFSAPGEYQISVLATDVEGLALVSF